MKLAATVVALVQLRQAAFEQCGGHPDQCRNPHPEHGTRTAQGYSHADTGDVARPDTAGQAEHEGLEGTDLSRTAGKAVLEHLEHVQEIAQLHKPCLDGEISAQADDQDDKQLSRKKAIDGFEHDATSLLL